jgi:hypothetical protein
MLFVLLPLPSSRTELLLPLSVSCTAPNLPLVPTITKTIDINYHYPTNHLNYLIVNQLFYVRKIDMVLDITILCH